MEESQSRCCGICLIDEGKSIRGQIDCCDHYFCFVCIMEWAKIESKCPMCNRRFSSIRRPPKEGVFLRERYVFVPKRDQIYCRFGNATSGPCDPYVNVRCSVCQGAADESLLLLCDLCDTASHTYCVGMGNTIPEGDWFCHDCTVLRDEHNNAEIDIDIDIGAETVGDCDVSQGVVESSGSEHKKVETVTKIFNGGGCQSIIENSRSDCSNADFFRNVEGMPQGDRDFALFEDGSSIPHPRESLFRFWSSNPVSRKRGIVVLDNATSLNQKTDRNTAGNSTELGARTLQRCRDVQGRVQAIRENWSALQNSSLRFISFEVELGAKRHKRNNVDEVLHEKYGQSCPSTSGSGQYLRSQYGSSCDSPDVEKAWKMMKTAKSMIKKSERASRVCQSSKNPSIIVNASKQTTNTSSTLPNAGIQQHRYVMSDCQNQIRAVESCERLQSTYSTRLTKSPAYGKTQTQSDVYNDSGPILSAKNICGASSSFANGKGGSCSVNLTRLVPRTSYSHDGEPDVCMSTSKMDTHEGNDYAKSEARKYGHAERETRKYDHAKSEIQSLVKLNLKLLSRVKRLEYDAFKKVARFATHTILAACGLEQPKSGIHFHPSSKVCSHSESIEQLCKSTLMPDSCQECFYVFVKDVVRSIMSEKVDHGTGRMC